MSFTGQTSRKKTPVAHHEALHAFAAYLAEGEDAATTILIKELAKGASVWVRAKAAIGKLMLRLGAALTKDLEQQRKKRVTATTQVALKQLRLPKSAP